MSTVTSSETFVLRIRERGAAHVADAASYWLIIAGVYLMYGFLWYYAGKEKLFDQNGTMPPPLAKAFHGSFVASVPGTSMAWVRLGLLEWAGLGGGGEDALEDLLGVLHRRDRRVDRVLRFRHVARISERYLALA